MFARTSSVAIRVGQHACIAGGHGVVGMHPSRPAPADAVPPPTREMAPLADGIVAQPPASTADQAPPADQVLGSWAHPTFEERPPSLFSADLPEESAFLSPC